MTDLQNIPPPPAPFPLWTIRPFRLEGDLEFVLGTWKQNFRDAQPVFRVPGRAYFEGQARVIERLLALSEVKIACDREADEVIWGWACGEHNLLHYVFVKEKFRKNGIGKALVNSFTADGLRPSKDPVTFTHWPPPQADPENLWLEYRVKLMLEVCCAECGHRERSHSTGRAGNVGCTHVQGKDTCPCVKLRTDGAPRLQYNPYRAWVP